MTAIIAILVGLLLAGAGIYYLAKEKGDREARRIYGATLAAGVLLAGGGLVWLLIGG